MGLLYLYHSMELHVTWNLEVVPTFLGNVKDLVLWKPSSHYRVHEILPLISVLNQINPFHTIPCFFHNILFDVIHLCLGIPSDSFPSAFPTLTLNIQGYLK